MYWMSHDAIGSIVGITKDGGVSDHNYRYSDFGEVEPDNGNFTAPHNNFTYTGQELDPNYGIYEFFSRAYDPTTGVWNRQDEYRGEYMNPQSLHRYGYVMNDPIGNWDAYGYAVPVVVIAGAAFTAEQLLAAGLITAGSGYVAVNHEKIGSAITAVGNELGNQVGYAWGTFTWHVDASANIVGDVFKTCTDLLSVDATHKFAYESNGLKYDSPTALSAFTLYNESALLAEKGLTNEELLSTINSAGGSGFAGGGIDPRDPSKSKFNIDGKEYEMSEHAIQEMHNGNLTRSDVINTIKNGKSIQYQNNMGPVTGYRTANGTFVAVGDNGTVITVIEKTSPNYLQNILNNPLYKPLP